MSSPKESKFAFDEGIKESFQQRLKSLIGERSVRQAALDWGLPASTINNYLHKGTEPALKVVLSIAKAEQVSLEWLAAGLNKDQETKSNPLRNSEDPLKFTWLMIYESLSRRDAEGLIRLIHKEGAKGLLAIAGGNDELDEALLLLPKEEKERLMALHEAKKGASEGGEVGNTTSPASDQRQAS